MMAHIRSKNNAQGVALVTALGLLLLFAMLGTAYVRYMSVELDEARYELLDVRAEQLSEAAIMAAIGEIESALKRGETPKARYAINLPLYYHRQDGVEPFDQTITVQVKDESSRININHASPELLEAIGIQASTAQKIMQSLPSQGNSSDARWFNSVDELRTRGFLDGPEYGSLSRESLTVYSADHDNASGFINLNSVSTTVLSFLFNIEPEEAGVLASKRPFTSWEDVLTKIGREPSTFNVGNIPYGSREKPKELAFQSRSFRLVSDGTIKNVLGTINGLYCSTEAVLLIDEDHNSSLRFWNVHPLEDAVEESVPEEESKPSADESANEE
jgi:type II secretory pathway component PulK